VTAAKTTQSEDCLNFLFDMSYVIRPLTADDWPAVREIYREGIATGNATFETELPAWEKWNASHREDCRLVAIEQISDSEAAARSEVLGWAALSPASSRRVYAGVAEVSVYVAAAARGCGVGKALLQALVDESEARGIWTLQAGIFPENAASIALHKACGFREVGVRQQIGRLGDTWRDVLLLELRSSRVGT
jgi:L-amino acid N-acyltransferase YncA